MAFKESFGIKSDVTSLHTLSFSLGKSSSQMRSCLILPSSSPFPILLRLLPFPLLIFLLFRLPFVSVSEMLLVFCIACRVAARSRLAIEATTRKEQPCTVEIRASRDSHLRDRCTYTNRHEEESLMHAYTPLTMVPLLVCMFEWRGFESFTDRTN